MKTTVDDGVEPMMTMRQSCFSGFLSMLDVTNPVKGNISTGSTPFGKYCLCSIAASDHVVEQIKAMSPDERSKNNWKNW